jgi:hypothetical protein
MSFFVKRSSGTRQGWTGPIRSERQADREVAAWQSAGWTAERVNSTPEIRREVSTWQKEANRNRNN